jgi:hypothetical protein
MEAEIAALLVGEWTTELTHRLLPGTVLHGRASFELLHGGGFLIVREQVDHPKFPGASIAIVGGKDLRMHYFDARGVARLFEGKVEGRAWSFTRTKPDFSALDFCQRITWRLSDDGQTITGLAEMAKDGGDWEDDLKVTYRRA